MGERVSFEKREGLALITMDDGKVNAVSPAMVEDLHEALDRAETAALPLVLTGRPGVFCGGFDLKVMRSAGLDTLRMLRGGFLLSARLLAHPYPVVIACSGHAIAMGAFLLLSGDYRFGVKGDFTVRANEVAIGLTLPRAAIAICRQRLNPACFDRATLLSEPFSPEEAVTAGFLDRVVEKEELLERALEHARSLGELDMEAHQRSKQRVRAETLRAIRAGTAADIRELSLLGARRALASLFQSKER